MNPIKKALHKEIGKNKDLRVNGRKVTKSMESSAKKAGFYRHNDPRSGDVYER